MRFYPGTLSLLAAATAIVATLGLWDGGPDRLRDSIPAGIPAGATVYYKTSWFRCAVALFRLDEGFAQEIATSGAGKLNVIAAGHPKAPDKSRYETWVPTPVKNDKSREIADLYESIDCSSESDLYSRLIREGAIKNGSFYSTNAAGSTAIVMPAQRLLLVGGYQ